MKATRGLSRGLCGFLVVAVLVGPMLVAGCGEPSGTGTAPEGTPPKEELKDSMDYMRNQLKNQKKGKKAAPRGPDPS